MQPAIRAPRFNTGKSNYFFSRSKHFANFSCCRLEIYCITPQNSPFCEGNTRATALFFINELRNRHMLVNPPEEWNEQDKHKTSTRQVTTSMCQTLSENAASRHRHERTFRQGDDGKHGIEGTSQLFGHVPHACHQSRTRENALPRQPTTPSTEISVEREGLGMAQWGFGWKLTSLVMHHVFWHFLSPFIGIFAH